MKEIQPDRQKDRQTDRQIENRQKERQKDRQIDRQMDRQIDRYMRVKMVSEVRIPAGLTTVTLQGSKVYLSIHSSIHLIFLTLNPALPPSHIPSLILRNPLPPSLLLSSVYTFGTITRAAVVHLNFRAGSTLPVLYCTVPHG